MRVLRLSLFLLLACVCVSYLAFRVFGAILIYQQDALKDDFVKVLANLDREHHNIVVPMSHPNSVEIGEKLAYFADFLMPEGKVKIYNFWELPYGNKGDYERFSGSVLQTPTKDQLQLADQDPSKITLWHFDLDNHANVIASDGEDKLNPLTMPNTLWHGAYLELNDYLLVSYGNPNLSLYRTRGVGLYAKELGAYVSTLPVEVSLVGGVSRSVGLTKIGWAIYQVKGFKNPAEFKRNEIKLSVALHQEEETRPSHLALGTGWHGLEKQGDAFFRWSGSAAEVIFKNFNNLTCLVSIDLDPLLSNQTPMKITLMLDKEIKLQKQINSRQNLVGELRFNGDSQQLSILAEGGYDSPVGRDTRLLKFKVFSIDVYDCKLGLNK